MTQPSVGSIAVTAIQLFSSIGFILLGASAAGIASLISGTSIFRDLSQYHARIIALTAGVIMFILSPLGYLVMYPEYFIYHGNPLPHPEGDRFVILPQLWGVIWSWKSMAPFFGLFLGFGLIYGALQSLNSRRIFFRKLRSATGAHLLLRTYETAWDSFFQHRKPRSPITIRTADGMIIGWVESVATRTEKREIRLCDYIAIQRGENLTEAGSDPPNPFLERWHRQKISGDLLVGEEEIKDILVPRPFMKKHRETADHVTQGFYIILIGLGCLLIYLSAIQTLKLLWVDGPACTSMPPPKGSTCFYKDLLSFYNFIALFALTCSAALMWCSLLFPAKDLHRSRSAGSGGIKTMYDRLSAAVSLNEPYIKLMMATFSSALLALMWWMPDPRWWRTTATWVTILFSLFILCHLAGLLFAMRLWFKSGKRRCRLRQTFSHIYNILGKEGEYTLRRLLDELYCYLDLNEEEDKRYNYDSLKVSLLERVEYVKLAKPFFENLDETAGEKYKGDKYDYKGDEYNLIATFRHWLERGEQYKLDIPLKGGSKSSVVRNCFARISGRIKELRSRSGRNEILH